MARGGQVYYIHNRVDTIEKKAQEIAEIVEEARIAIAHGQMNETELENIMIAFLEGDYDVLVSTTIIETGVDIPNVNTLIVGKDRKSTRLNSSHVAISYAVFCLKKKK